MNSLITDIQNGSFKALARSISLVENEAEGYEDILMQLTVKHPAVIGITGAPGSGKSTIVDALIKSLVSEDKRVGVLCVDPSSPFNFGAVLGDRIRMNTWYNNENVFIRSLASRGSLGGLHSKIIEITDVMKAADFDYIIIETVGVGQSEVEIAGLADTTVVVLVPEGGDEIQSMKAGVMEIADIFVVNKSDRPDADAFEKNIRHMLSRSSHEKFETPVIKTIATQHTGIDLLVDKIKEHRLNDDKSNKKFFLLAEKAFYIIRQQRMKDVDKKLLEEKIKEASKNGDFNLYKFISSYTG